ncbi:MAG: hypothetical protein M1827_001812 [Pycnora praestabilis]|nr:MAG: hypothetical protein M1827_001812 [Pycnora praestabilis]
MRLKKKARRPSPAGSTPSRENPPEPIAASLETETPGKATTAPIEDPPDSWTDDQETSLFKAMIRWIPKGMHKHFRMIAISQHMRSHGYTSQEDAHTRIPGIWQKLGALYNLQALDEREDSFGDEETESDGSTPRESFFAFRLPDIDYGDMMFERRLATEGSESPLALALPLVLPPSKSKALKRGGQSDRSASGTGRASTIDDTEEEPRSSPVSSMPRKPTRGTRGSKATPKSRIQAESKKLVGKRNSRAAPMVEEEENTEEPMEVEEEDEVEEEHEEADEEEVAAEDEGDETARSPTSRSTKIATKGQRGGRQKAGRGTARRSTRKK